jgi:hypothetical protein
VCPLSDNYKTHTIRQTWRLGSLFFANQSLCGGPNSLQENYHEIKNCLDLYCNGRILTLFVARNTNDSCNPEQCSQEQAIVESGSANCQKWKGISELGGATGRTGAALQSEESCAGTKESVHK